jgi:hypothetical protein
MFEYDQRMDYVFRKNDTTGLNMWMLLLLIISIEVKSHEDGRNGDQNDEGGILRDSTNISWLENNK